VFFVVIYNRFVDSSVLEMWPSWFWHPSQKILRARACRYKWQKCCCWPEKL